MHICIYIYIYIYLFATYLSALPPCPQATPCLVFANATRLRLISKGFCNTEHTGSTRGEIYGADHSYRRFSLPNVIAQRPDLPELPKEIVFLLPLTGPVAIPPCVLRPCKAAMARLAARPPARPPSRLPDGPPSHRLARPPTTCLPFHLPACPPQRQPARPPAYPTAQRAQR